MPGRASTLSIGSGRYGTAGLQLFNRALLLGREDPFLALNYLQSCSALLSTRDWLAEFQTYLLSFTPLGISHISFPGLCPPVTLSPSFPGPFTFALWALAAEQALSHLRG